MPSPPLVTVYRRRDCHLCDQAREELEALRSAGSSFELRELDIDSDERLRTRFTERIPVIELEGEIVSELGVDVEGLLVRLDTVSA